MKKAYLVVRAVLVLLAAPAAAQIKNVAAVHHRA